MHWQMIRTEAINAMCMAIIAQPLLRRNSECTQLPSGKHGDPNIRHNMSPYTGRKVRCCTSGNTRCTLLRTSSSSASVLEADSGAGASASAQPWEVHVPMLPRYITRATCRVLYIHDHADSCTCGVQVTRPPPFACHLLPGYLCFTHVRTALGA